MYFLSGSPDCVFLFSGPDVGSIVGQPAYFEELKSEMAELYGSLAEQVRADHLTWQTVILPVLRIRDILVRIRIHGSALPLTNGFGSCYFHQ